MAAEYRNDELIPPPLLIVGILEDWGQREKVWFTCGHGERDEVTIVDLQHINPQYSITSIEMTTAHKGHGSAPNSDHEFTAKDRHRRLHGCSEYTMHKRRPTHGSAGE